MSIVPGQFFTYIIRIALAYFEKKDTCGVSCY